MTHGQKKIKVYRQDNKGVITSPAELMNRTDTSNKSKCTDKALCSAS